MSFKTMNLKIALFGGVALLALNAPAFADDAAILQRLDAMQKMIDAQQKQIEQQRAEITNLKHTKTVKPAAVARETPAPAQAGNQQAQIDELKTELHAYKNTQRLEKQDEPVWSFANGRPLVQSPDGRFTFSVRGLGQFDMGYYDQSKSAASLPAANGPSLSSGSNFRRAQLGIAGKLFGDWSYLFNYEFGGSNGSEQQGRVQSLYLQYDGLKPLAFRVGAYPPPAGIEDGTSAGDTLFIERNSPSEIARSLAGGDGRDAVTALYAGDKLFAALSYTGAKTTDAVGSAFGEQTAVLGRVSDLAYSDNDLNILVGAMGAYVANPAYNSAGPGSTHTITLATWPELTVDSTGAKLVSTGAINADNATAWGVEGAAQWRSLYAQAGYFGYGIDGTGATPADVNFDGWYLQGSWVLTGERHAYNKANGAFSAPKPSIPFSLAGGGLGAWEVALRYSDLDLNDNEGSVGSAVPTGGIRGGEQQILTAGINWYPNSLIRFLLNYEHVNIDRIGAGNADVGQSINIIALRSQVAF
ncbi:MAG TPA: porin [Parvibaculum sp.]|jgi:phosphate-selective porin OprO/OprP